MKLPQPLVVERSASPIMKFGSASEDSLKPRCTLSFFDCFSSSKSDEGRQSDERPDGKFPYGIIYWFIVSTLTFLRR